MERQEWLKKMRQETEIEYTTTWAPDYGEKYGLYPNATHLQFMQKFLEHYPAPGSIRDAACGSGRYFPNLLEAAHTVTGIDQSQGMLDQARKFFPQVTLVKVGLQEMAFVGQFDGAICMDALENICPEDWPIVRKISSERSKRKDFSISPRRSRLRRISGQHSCGARQPGCQ